GTALSRVAVRLRWCRLESIRPTRAWHAGEWGDRGGVVAERWPKEGRDRRVGGARACRGTTRETDRIAGERCGGVGSGRTATPVGPARGRDDEEGVEKQGVGGARRERRRHPREVVLAQRTHQAVAREQHEVHGEVGSAGAIVCLRVVRRGQEGWHNGLPGGG